MGNKLRALALTSADPQQSMTWRHRVEMILPELERNGVEVQTARIPRRQADVIKFFHSLRGFDIAWVHRRLFWPAEIDALRRSFPKIVLDLDDPTNYSSSAFCNFSFGRWLRFRATTSKVDAVLCASDGLVDLVQPLNSRAYFVPLCCELADPFLQPTRRNPDEPFRLFWIGSKATFKYLKGARLYLEEIGKACPNTELVLVAHSALELTNMPVQFLPWTAEAAREAPEICHVGLAPMSHNRWTRAKAALKPVQYLASGMPFIGNRVSVNPRVSDVGRNGILAEGPRQWVDAVKKLQNDEELRLRMAHNGIEYVRRYHSPSVLAGQVAQIFFSLTKAPHLRLAA